MRYALACILLFIFIAATPARAAADPTEYYVSTTGSDGNPGTPDAPFGTIQHALDLAQPGDTVFLAAGDYLQDVVSIRSGTMDLPIRIVGPSNAVLRGAGGPRIFQITHDYLTLEGFTIDGLWSEPTDRAAYRDKLLYVIGTQPQKGVTGLRVVNMTLRNSGGECLRLRYFAQRNEITRTTFMNCGVFDFQFNGLGKNGEAIYIGTAPEQLSDGNNPTDELDQSNNNWVHRNNFNTQGAECVNIKEGSQGNLIEYNNCTGQKDPKSAGFNVQGNANIFRFNQSYANAGAGFRLGGDTEGDGLKNDVYGNTIRGNAEGGIKVQRVPQGQICGNRFAGNLNGDVNGAFDEQLNPTGECPETLAVGATPPQPAARATSTPQARPTAPAIRATPGPTEASGAAAAAPTTQIDTTRYQPLAITSVSASDDDGNKPTNTIDDSLSTRWSARGEGQQITYDLGRNVSVGYVAIAFHEGDRRVADFAIEVSSNQTNWSRVFRGTSNGETVEPQTFGVGDVSARYVRIVGFGNTENLWNSLTEVDIYGPAARR